MKPEQFPYGVIPAGHGHYRYNIVFRGREYTHITCDTMAVDDFRSDDDEKDRRQNRRLRGAKRLRQEAISKLCLR